MFGRAGALMWWLWGCLVETGEPSGGPVAERVLIRDHPQVEQKTLMEEGGYNWSITQFGKSCAGDILVEQRSESGQQLTFLATNEHLYHFYLVEVVGSVLRWGCDVDRDGVVSKGIVSIQLKNLESRDLQMILPDPEFPPSVAMLVVDVNKAPEAPETPPLAENPPGDAPPGDAPPNGGTSEPPPTVAPVQAGGLSAPQ